MPPALSNISCHHVHPHQGELAHTWSSMNVNRKLVYCRKSCVYEAQQSGDFSSCCLATNTLHLLPKGQVPILSNWSSSSLWIVHPQPSPMANPCTAGWCLLLQPVAQQLPAQGLGGKQGASHSGDVSLTGHAPSLYRYWGEVKLGDVVVFTSCSILLTTAL